MPKRLIAIRITMPCLSAFAAIAGIAVLTAAGQAPERPPISWGRDTHYGFRSAKSRTYASPSGEFRLQVESREPYGRHGATNEFSDRGEPIWRKVLAYTLREVMVTDHGVTVGFAYREVASTDREGLSKGESECRSGSLLYLVILDRSGTELMRQSMCRCVPDELINMYPFPDPRPFVKQMVVDSAHSVAAFQITDWAAGCDESEKDDALFALQQTTWRTYSLKSGELLTRIGEDELLNQRSEVLSRGYGVVETVPIVDRPLFLMHALMPGANLLEFDARFLLVDYSGEIVWSKDVADEYSIVGGLGSFDTITASLFHFEPAILDVTKPGSFDVRFFREKTRVSYAVERAVGDSWRVTETMRQPLRE